ncbi:MAG: hypothetical protein GY821_02440 [Gammaproteobacteria bacterium]|nr:hypothetical protein [Gammaproteobacteria bacterium]
MYYQSKVQLRENKAGKELCDSIINILDDAFPLLSQKNKNAVTNMLVSCAGEHYNANMLTLASKLLSSKNMNNKEYSKAMRTVAGNILLDPKSNENINDAIAKNMIEAFDANSPASNVSLTGRHCQV